MVSCLCPCRPYQRTYTPDTGPFNLHDRQIRCMQYPSRICVVCDGHVPNINTDTCSYTCPISLNETTNRFTHQTHTHTHLHTFVTMHVPMPISISCQFYMRQAHPLPFRSHVFQVYIFSTLIPVSPPPAEPLQFTRSQPQPHPSHTERR